MRGSTVGVMSHRGPRQGGREEGRGRKERRKETPQNRAGTEDKRKRERERERQQATAADFFLHSLSVPPPATATGRRGWWRRWR